MKHIKNQRGFAVFVALIMVMMLTLIGLVAMSTSNDEVSIAGNELQETRAFYSAEAGLEVATSMIQTIYDSTGKPPTYMPSGSLNLNGSDSVIYSVTEDGVAKREILSDGTFAGLYAITKTYAVISTAWASADQARVDLSVEFDASQIPIFQFAVFYEDDLQATPQPNMTLNGRVHTNGNMHLQAFAGLYIDGFVTSAGSINHGLIFGQYSGSATAGVYVKDRVGLYQNMNQGGSWIDASHPDWHDQSLSLWGGKVQDQAHGQGRLNLPLADILDPHRIIEPAAGNPDSYEHKATLKFIDGVAYQKFGGVWSDVTANMIADGVIIFSTDQFYDDREDEWVDVMELDMGAMYANGYSPSNGVLYFSDDEIGSNWPAIRLKNGATLDSALTIASETPLYVEGDYNIVNKVPASVIADAVTILSGNWDDSKSTMSKGNRPATNTVINMAFVTGDTDPSPASYGGGIENLPRFLESWNPAKLTLRGSFINLWKSAQADGPWSISYYVPPVRDWAYDTFFDDPANLPPATPMLMAFRAVSWQQHDIAYKE